MANANKRVAVRKKSSKRGKGSTKSARKMAAKNATLKKVKSKVRRAKKSVAKKRRPLETVERTSKAEMLVETTAIDTIKEPASSVVAVAEYKSVETATDISAGGEPKCDEGTSPAGTSSMFPDQGERPGHETDKAA
jgi:hypothetical protein